MKENLDSKNIYFDYQATSPIDGRVLEAMMPAMTTEFGNPASKTHSFGWSSEKILEKAREQVANVINADTKDIIFTSGATESNNLAIKGVARFNKDEKNHIITTKIEHKCVLESCKYLEAHEGFKVTYLDVDKDGLINLEQLKNSITDKTVLVSIMCVNNEIGTIQDLESIGKICKENNVYFHTDCAQAFGKINLDVEKMNIDLMSISGHKIYAPKGIGALYVRRKKPRVKMEAIIHGGGQERGLRSGTSPVFLAVGLGEASKIALQEMDKDAEKIKIFANKIIKEFLSMKKVYLNGSKTNRWFGCLNFTFAGVEGESIIMGLKNIAVSSGSACTSATLDPSYVIKAIGVDDAFAHSSIRIGLGRFTTEEEVDYLIKKMKSVVEHLRKMSPLWEMMENGVDLTKIKWLDK